MIETYWGNPVTLIEGPGEQSKTITTVEQALFRLGKRWPDRRGPKHRRAVDYARAACECLTAPGAARQAFIDAAEEAGLRLVA
ncbi:DUF982 domain-containing protein [Cereibacter sp. SYSU M97828]|nr:DUF982 domain-containing protein [Cereibacter flavus]